MIKTPDQILAALNTMARDLQSLRSDAKNQEIMDLDLVNHLGQAITAVDLAAMKITKAPKEVFAYVAPTRPTPAPEVGGPQIGIPAHIQPRTLDEAKAGRKALDLACLPKGTLILIRYGRNGTQVARVRSVNGAGNVEVDRFVSGVSWDKGGAPTPSNNVIGLVPSLHPHRAAALAKINDPAKAAR